MAQTIKQANIFGRIGSGIGQGLAEQIPKEIERNRLSSGLEKLGQQQDLTPFQQFTGLVKAAHEYPQIVQSGSDLLRQQAMAKALGGQPQSRPQDFFADYNKEKADQVASKVPSITKSSPLEKLQEGYYSPSVQERDARAAELFRQNPGRYNNNPQNAIEAADREVDIEKERQQQAEKHAANLTHIQDNLVSRLKQHSGNLGVQIPETTYSDIENEAIQSVKPVSEGGKGLTEQQAMKEFGKKMDRASRDYSDLSNLGSWRVLTGPAHATATNLRALRDRFEERGDLENFADKLIAMGYSPMFSYAGAYPIGKSKDLSYHVKKLPTLKTIETLAETVVPDQANKTRMVIPQIAKAMGNGSPLSIAYQLYKKNYDPQIWLDYLVENRKKLDLTERQASELSKKVPVTSTIGDFWLSEFADL